VEIVTVSGPHRTSSHAAAKLARLSNHHHERWRHPAQVVGLWEQADRIDLRLLQHKVRGQWWDVLARHDVTLLVTREYEHLVLALRADKHGGVISYLPMPHPSGLAVDRRRGIVHLASTRNPNQIIDLRPVRGLLARQDVTAAAPPTNPLTPVRSRFLPGCLYLHDLAMIGGQLHGNAVGQNAVVRLDDDGGHERVWWPKSIESGGKQAFGRNYLQLNSIAAGADLAGSFFSASTPKIGARRPGQRNFPVDGRGVIFSGATRQPIVGGLTRPHSARLHRGQIWVDNSGYGQVGVASGGRFETVAALPGWTRGLSLHDGVAFVGVSRVIPRFSVYAPGLEVDEATCGVHAVEAATGKVLGSITWPAGNQIFAVEWVPRSFTGGFPSWGRRSRSGAGATELFYAFETRTNSE
jgi:uncharacterized protein (TIGR03032 family)